MAQGKSGRIVIEIDRDLKTKLYVELAKKQLTMKGWFIGEARQLIEGNDQLLLWDNHVDTTDQSKGGMK